MSQGNKLANGASLISTPISSKSTLVLLISVLSWIFLLGEVSGASLENGGGISSSKPTSFSRATDLLTSSSSPSVRAKRSRTGEQQLCGYRLLDALRSVCDRNFVGFTRRSDPTLFIQGGAATLNEGQSGEELGAGGSAGGMPWDSLTMEQPMYNSQPAPPLQDNGLNFNWDDLEYSQPGAGFSSNNLFWPPRLASSSGGTKGFALKLLAEPPNVHQRFRRNIIDECCKKPCAMNQMLKYCAITAGKRSF
ncbi:unnamed protein product [Orchesella dallaii]|uniref:Insulin-like domain-containing protein n=1 Tax=Orchesella dallaii TaxID=48710 RepID=A0ABP1R533_9HEXA